ncbi:hypothetical protein GIB67_014418, partial [Kingdonia uniflora]
MEFCNFRGNLVLEGQILLGNYMSMMDLGVVGYVDTAGFLIRGYCKDGNFEEGYNLLMEFLQSGCALDVIVLTKLMPRYCKIK